MQLHQLLKTKTSEAHQALEKRIVSYIKNIETLPGYKLLLQQYYGFIHPLEIAIRQHIGSHLVTDIDHRIRHPLLQQDLALLGIDNLETIAEAPAPSFVYDDASALGSLYVLEGSTLGGKFIVEMLRRKLSIENGYSYFAGYGEHNDIMWKAFVAVLNKQQQQQFITEAVNAATETFNQFDLWLHKHLQPDTNHV